MRNYGERPGQPDSGGNHYQSPGISKMNNFSHHASPSYKGETPGGLSVFSNNPAIIKNTHFEVPNRRLQFTPIK